MISAIDSSVLLDILTADTRFLDKSRSTIDEVRMKGRLIVSPVVVAEIFPLLGSQVLVSEFLSDLSMEFVDFGLEASLLAGGIFSHYRKNKGPRKRLMSDFLVGAHAFVHADALLTRDDSFFRPNFRELKIIDPSPA